MPVRKEKAMRQIVEMRAPVVFLLKARIVATLAARNISAVLNCIATNDGDSWVIASERTNQPIITTMAMRATDAATKHRPHWPSSLFFGWMLSVGICAESGNKVNECRCHLYLNFIKITKKVEIKPCFEPNKTRRIREVRPWRVDS